MFFQLQVLCLVAALPPTSATSSSAKKPAAAAPVIKAAATPESPGDVQAPPPAISKALARHRELRKKLAAQKASAYRMGSATGFYNSLYSQDHLNSLGSNVDVFESCCSASGL